MGIKVACPNGHKLNVKSFLAGKRGVCPHCGEKFDIPAEKGEAQALGSVSSLTSAPSANSGGTGTGASAATTSGEHRKPVSPVAGTNPAVKAPASGAAAPSPPGSVPQAAPAAVGNPASLPAPVAPAHMPDGLPPAMSGSIVPVVAAQPIADPLAEAPEACWYVRPPSGGQYGPAKPNIMRQWISEGRVTPDSLVWREGWADWKLAGATFPNLPAAAPVIPSSPVVFPAAGPTPVQPVEPFGSAFPNVIGGPAPLDSPRKPALYRRRDNTSVRILALTVLFIALIALTVLLVWVLNLNSS